MGKEIHRAIPSPAEQLGGDNEPIDLSPLRGVRCKTIPVDKLAERDSRQFGLGYAAGVEEATKVIDSLRHKLAAKDAWQPLITAPKDGAMILGARDNGCGWEYVAVYWSEADVEYPWQSIDNAYPEDHFDSWQSLQEPAP